MMTAEQRFLLSCLRHFLSQKTIDTIPDTIDPEELFRIANEHSIDSLVFSICHKYLSFGTAEAKFRGVFSWHIFYSANRKELLKEIVERFRQNDIPVICFKGSVFRDYYPDSALRTMGDIDLIIHTKDRSSVDRILQENMRFNRLIDNHDVWTYWVRQFQFEVHDHMFYENLANRVDYRSYFDQVWEHCHNAPVFGIESDNLFVPDESFHFLYLMTHTAKHIINNGSGFRAYLDMVLMVKNCELDWDWLENELIRLKLFDFTKTCFALCERWFDVKMPLGKKQIEESFFEEVTEKTFRDGIFGLENDQNAGAHSAKEIKRNGSYIGGSLKITLQKVFPPYRDMQLIPWYAWVDGKPWLLPAAWVYRWGYCIKNKRKDSMDLLTEPFVKKEIVKKREILIQNWGL